MTLAPAPRTPLRTAARAALAAFALVTLFGHTDDPVVDCASCPAPPPAGCQAGVTAGFSGDPGWTSADGAVGTGADGRGGVAIAASVSLGPIRGAQVTVRRADGSVVGTAATADDGLATLTACGQAGPFLVEVAGQAGATYFDESRGAAGERVAFGPGELLRAYVPALTANVGVTPFTEAAVQALGTGAASDVPGGSAATKALPDAAAIRGANERVRALANALLPPRLAIADPTAMPAPPAAGTPALPDTDGGRHALALAALGRQAGLFNPGLAAPASAGARQLARDAADGRVDGLDASGAPVAPIGERTYDPARLRLALASASATSARRHAAPSVLDALPAVTTIGAVGLPDARGVAVQTGVRLRRTGALHALDADGADASVLANDVAEIWGASQRPATALFLKGVDGTVRSIGFGGTAGLLGTGAAGGTAVPVVVAALRNATHVALGAEHALARRADGTVLGWGNGARAQLAAAASTPLPVPIPEAAGAASVLAIGDASFALTGDGRVLAWGTAGAALGGGATAATARRVPSPVLVEAGRALDRVVAIAGYVGTSGTPDPTLAAVRADGTVWAWGDNATGGLGAAGGAQGFARPVPGLARIVRVVASAEGFVALDADGGVFVWGRSTVPGTTTPTTLAPTRIDGMPPVRDLGPAFQGVHQARLIDADGQAWRVDGLGVAQVTERTELSLQAPPPGIVTIGTIAGDDRVNAAERAQGVTVTGTVSQANRPVTVIFGNATRVVTATGTSWTASFAGSELPLSGTATVSASFVTTTGAQSAATTRTVTLDSTAPRVDILSNGGTRASGPVTFSFRWSEPVTGFGRDDLSISPASATVGPLLGQGAEYTLTVTPTAGVAGDIVVEVRAAAASDAAGNGNAAAVRFTQPYSTDSTPPTVTITESAVYAYAPNASSGQATLQFTFLWSEDVTDFTPDDLSFANATLDSFQVDSARRYRAVVSPQGTGPVTVTVATGAAEDLAGVRSGPVAPRTVTSLERNYGAYDAASPGGGDGNLGGSAGDAGNPGIPPGAPTITRVEVLDGAWRIGWAADTVGARPTFYQIVIREFGRLERYGEPIPAITDGYSVVVPARPTARYRIRACNVDTLDQINGYHGCDDSQDLPETTLVKASPVRPGVQVGSSLSVSADGLRLVTGAVGDSTRGPSAGAAHVFTRSPSGVVQEAVLFASNAAGLDGFGAAVAVSADGNTIAVGATGEDSGARGVNGNQLDESVPNSGAVYVFARTVDTSGRAVWTQQAYLKPSDPATNLAFGYALALSGDGGTLVVGGPAPGTSAGSAYVFVRTGSTWTQQARLAASNADPGDGFGQSVAIARNGALVVVGAPSESSRRGAGPTDNSASAAGAAYVFARSGTAWSQQALLKASNADALDRFGSAVAVSADGSTIVVTAPSEASSNIDPNDNSAFGTGAAYVFVKPAAAWTQQAYLKPRTGYGPPNLGRSGIALSATGDRLYLGAQDEDGIASGLDGYFEQYSSGNFGFRITSTYSGAVYRYQRTASAWDANPVYVKAPVNRSGDFFGAALATSDDGRRLYAGAPGDDADGLDSGGVHVYLLQ